MKRFYVTVSVWEDTFIDYTVIVNSNTEENAQLAVEKAIKKDGTAFLKFDVIDELIVETKSIEGEKEEVSSVRELSRKGDIHENHF